MGTPSTSTVPRPLASSARAHPRFLTQPRLSTSPWPGPTYHFTELCSPARGAGWHFLPRHSLSYHGITLHARDNPFGASSDPFLDAPGAMVHWTLFKSSLSRAGAGQRFFNAAAGPVGVACSAGSCRRSVARWERTPGRAHRPSRCSAGKSPGDISEVSSAPYVVAKSVVSLNVPYAECVRHGGTVPGGA